MTTEAPVNPNIQEAIRRIKEMLDSPHKPDWIEPLFQTIFSEPVSSYSIHHTLNDIQLAIGLMDDDDQDAINGWIESDTAPEWFNRALEAFMIEKDVWMKSRIMADLSLAYPVIALIIEPADEEE